MPSTNLFEPAEIHGSLLLLLNSLGDAAAMTDLSGRVRFWNKAADSMFGWSATEMIGRPLTDRIPECAQADLADYIHHWHEGVAWEGEVHDYRKDGSRVWSATEVRPIRDEIGALLGVLSLMKDIGKQKAAESENVDRTEFSAAILNALSAQVAVLFSDGKIRQVNRAWEQFAIENSPDGEIPNWTGVNYVQLCRGSVGEHSEEAGAAAEGIEEVLTGKRPFFVLEYPCHSPTKKRWFAMHATPLMKPEKGAVVAHYDITDRKLAELEINSQSRQFELALTAAQMGVWSLDLSTQQMLLSSEVYHLLGVDSFDGTLAAWEKLIHQEDLASVRACYGRAVESRMPVNTEFRVEREDGSIRWIANFARVECTPEGEPIRLNGTVEDITTRKRSEWALVSYNHILEMIATGAGLKQTLDEVVRLVEEQLPGSLCSVLLVDRQNNRLRFGAGASLPEVYNRAVDGILIGPKSGSCGTAAFRKETVAVSDVATDPLWEDFRDLALANGLRSCISVPIFSSGNVPNLERGTVIGTFALYSRRIGTPDQLTYAVLSGAKELARHAIQMMFHGKTHSSPLTDSTQIAEATHLAGVAIEREQAATAVRESEERFRCVLDSSPVGVYLTDLEGRLIFANRAMTEVFGMPVVDWMGKRPCDILPRPIADQCNRCDLRVLESLGHIHDRIRWRRPNGKEVTVLVTHFPLLNDERLTYAACGIFNDITDLVRAQKELYQLWTHAPEPMCVAGFDGNFRQLNPAWSRCLGWPDEELLGRPWFEFVHPDDRDASHLAFQQLTDGKTVQRFENRFRRADGTFRWFSWDAIPLPEDRTIYGFVRDVTEEKKLGEQFRQAQKMEAIGQLASGIAHDFNNLLTIINGYCDLMLGQIPSIDKNKEFITQIRVAGQRAAELTAQLLAFSRKAIIEPKLLDINRLIESAANMLRRLIGEDIRLELNLNEVQPIKMDPGQIEQVFMNLAVNARDAMPTGGKLMFGTELVECNAGDSSSSKGFTPTQYVRMTIKDTGTGMSPAVRSRIFEPFFTTKDVGKGTGLGLATVFGIVQQAGGSIEVESEEEGRERPSRFCSPLKRRENLIPAEELSEGSSTRQRDDPARGGRRRRTNARASRPSTAGIQCH
ncbi:MAG: PAS domain S-box protein [Planctomycetota bacterium]